MLRFSWNHPRRCVRLRGDVLIDEIGNHLTWLVRKRSVKVLQLGRVFSKASTKHACALWCPVVCGILCCCGTTRHSRLPPHTHSPTHSLTPWLSVWLAIDCKILRTSTKPNITLHVINHIPGTHVKPLTTENNTSFRLLVHFMLQNHQDPSSRVRAP